MHRLNINWKKPEGSLRLRLEEKFGPCKGGHYVIPLDSLHLLLQNQSVLQLPQVAVANVEAGTSHEAASSMEESQSSFEVIFEKIWEFYTQEINPERPTNAMTGGLSLKEVSAANATQWIFPSTANKNKLKHSVIKNDYYCECKMKCSSCKVCVYQYSCSCADYAIHSVPCKHIHAIHSIFFENNKQGVQNYGAKENEDVTGKRQYFQHQLNKTDKITDLAFIKESIQGKMNILSNKVEICSVPEALEAAHEHLKNAIAVLDGILSLNSNQQSLQQAEVFPHNKHFEKQRKFYSRKQKATKKKRTLTKASIEDTNNVKENLKQQEVRLCGI